ncbi:YhdP family protein [Mycetohabitans rhizoxinica]|uniref:YhdP family phospholipid transporter n=1 Tax=Mycetohabitans rhizoxinica TaxID=412963 RepID=UPI0030CEA653
MPDRQETLDPNDARNAQAGSGWRRGPSEQVLRRVLACCASVAITLYFGAAATYVGLRYVIFPQLDSLRPHIEQRISDTLHAQVHIGRLTGRWSGLQPTLDIDQLTIMGPDGQRMLAVPTASATLSWRSLPRLAPVLSSLIVEQPEVFAERHPDGTYTIAGVRVDPRQHGNSALLHWLMTQRAIVLRGGVLHWSDAQRGLPTLTLRGIHVAIDNRGLIHRLGVQAQPDGRLLRGPLDLRARLRHSPLKPLTEPAGWTGTMFVSSGNLALPELARYTDARLDAQSGTLDVAAWLDFASGEWSGARGALSGSALRLRMDPTLPRLDVPSIGLDWSLRRNDMRNLDYTLSLGNLRAELGGQVPLADGTPITRLLSIGEFNGRFRRATLGRGQLIRIRGDTVDLGLLAQFVRTLPLPHPVLNELDRFDPRGTLANYAIQVERRAPRTREAASVAAVEGGEPIVRYRVKAALEGVSVGAQEPPPGLTPGGHPHVGLPGAENIWGKIDADQNGGHATIDTTHGAVTIPGAFDNPRLTFNRFAAEATWTAHPLASDATRPAVAVNLSRFVVDNDDVRASATGTYSNPGHGRGKLDMEAMFDRLSLPRLARYLPTGVDEHTRAYLDHALTAGTSHNATIAIHGELAEFPYTHDPHAGIFKIVAPFRDGGFDPTPHPPKRMSNGTPQVWPAFDGIDGLFRMDQNVLRFDIQRARYQRVALTQLTGRIDDLGTLNSDLVINGVASGPLADMLDYVNRSSLAVLSDHLGETVRAKGNATLALRLAIPRHPDKPHVGVNGSVTLADNAVSFVPGKQLAALPPVTQIHGKVDFTEHTMTIGRASGQFLGGEIHTDGGIQQDGSSRFDVSGHLLADAARTAVPPGPLATLLTRMSGGAPYSVAVRTRKNELPDISATSDLSGLALQLPAPFTKPTGVPMPFSLRLRPATAGERPATGISRLDARLGPLNAIYLVRRGNDDKLAILRGALGVNREAVLPSEGVTAAAHVAHFDADAWRALLDAMSIPAEAISGEPAAAAAPSLLPAPTYAAPSASSPDTASPFNLTGNVAALVPTRVGLHFDTLTLLNRRWENVVIGATHTPGAWQANIASDDVSGHLAWHAKTPRSPYGQLDARLAKLVVPDSHDETLVSRVLEEPAQHVPAIDLIVNELTVRGHNFGKLEVNARNIDENGVPVWQLDKLDVTNPAAKLSATASWRTPRRARTSTSDNGTDDNPRRTALDFKLDIADGGALLDRLGLPRTLKGGNGTLSGKVGWRGGPTRIDYPTLSGNLSLGLSHGQILKVEPGAAKLLGVLSLQALARVATLDLGTLFGEGLPFDNVTATGTISHGIAKTEDFTLNSAAAKVTMQGNADLGCEQQDLLVTVVPSLSVGTAALATAVVNPLLGLGTFVAGLVLSDPISQSFARHYAVTGSWSHPQVEQVSDDRGKMGRPGSHVSRQ